MKEVEHEQEICFNTYKNALKVLNNESQMQQKHRHHHEKQPEEVSYENKKREADPDDRVKKVCW